MLKFLTNLPWKRVITAVGSAVGAYEAMPDSAKSDPYVWTAVGLSALAGAAVNAERVFASKKRQHEGG